DAPAETEAMSRWIVNRLGSDVPVHFTAFHPDWKLRDRPATPAATLTRGRDIARVNGIRYAYTGNVHDPTGQSPPCAGRGTRRARAGAGAWLSATGTSWAPGVSASAGNAGRAVCRAPASLAGCAAAGAPAGYRCGCVSESAVVGGGRVRPPAVAGTFYPSDGA